MDFMRHKPDYVISTTVIKPVINLAAVPYLQFWVANEWVFSMRLTQWLDELVSDIWLAPRQGIEAFLNTPPSTAIAAYVQAATEIIEAHKP